MANELILETPEVATLERLIEEATRSTDEGIRRFVEPASGTLSRTVSRQHHLIFGRRGSGKSSLLRKAAADLTVDRRPIAYVDLETFKGHAYPDVLLSVLIETLSKFAEWLDTAAVAPSNMTSFWKLLFGKSPTRPAFDRTGAKNLAKDLRAKEAELRKLLFAEDAVSTEEKQSDKSNSKNSDKDNLTLGSSTIKLAIESESTQVDESAREIARKYTVNKLDYLHRHILEYKAIFRRMATLSNGDSFLFLDDLYHVRRRDQAQVIDYFHRIGKGNRLWLKIGTIRHRSTWYINGDPPIGTKIGDDIQEIDLDLTLEKYNITKAFLTKILDTFLAESGVRKDDLLAGIALDRLVLASGGVTRDFLGILRGSVLIARERGETYRGSKIGAEDVNGATGTYDTSKREELKRDTIDESHRLEEELSKIGAFVTDYSNANVFLVDKGLPTSDLDLIEELVDLRLVHKVKSQLTVADRPGKKFEAYMLDVSQYTAFRKRRELDIIEFWRADAADSIRRPGLIYKEFDGANVILKTSKST